MKYLKNSTDTNYSMFLTNPEVICRKIGNGFFLLSSKKTWDKCPYVQQISETGAFYWNLLEKGIQRDEMLDCFLREYNIMREEASEDLDYYIDMLIEYHYLTKIE